MVRESMHPNAKDDAQDVMEEAQYQAEGGVNPGVLDPAPVAMEELRRSDGKPTGKMTRYMVIETFKPGALGAIYERLHAHGRGLPDGLEFVESWLAAGGSRCFQIMQTEDVATFAKWTPYWADLVDFEIVELGEKPAAKAR